MCPINRRVPAFTLIEMLVVLLLTAIISGIIYSVYFTVNSYRISLTKKVEAFEDFSSSYYLLGADIERCLRMDIENERTIVCQVSEVVIKYQFLETAIVRSQLSEIDTFFCENENLQFSLQGRSKKEGLIDEASFDINYDLGNLKVVFRKHYDAATVVSMD